MLDRETVSHLPRRQPVRYRAEVVYDADVRCAWSSSRVGRQEPIASGVTAVEVSADSANDWTALPGGMVDDL